MTEENGKAGPLVPGPLKDTVPPGRLRLVLAVVLVAATAGAVTQAAGSSGAAPTRPEPATVRTAALACPTPGVRAADATSVVSLAVPPAPGKKVTAAKGKATLSDLTGRSIRGELSAAGIDRTDVSDLAVPAQLAEGLRGLAPGLAADLVTQGASGAARGLAATPCVLPGTTAWFLGAGTTSGRRTRLLLLNADATPATLDLTFWGERGPVDVPNSDEITVPPRGVREFALEALAPGKARLAVGVTVARGRVAATLHEQSVQGSSGRGIDWVAPTPAPARTVVIPGVPSGSFVRRLQLLAPGGSDATVKVRLLTKDNEFAPAGLDAVDLQSGRIAEFDLKEAANAEAVAIVVTSDEPVLAAVRVVRTVAGVTDVAYATAARPLTTPATMPLARARTTLTSRLMLTAPEGDAVVTLRPLQAKGIGKPRTVRIPAGRTVVVDPDHGTNGTCYAVVIEPEGDTPVYATRIVRAGATDITVSPVLGGRYTVVIPDVVPDLGAATAEDRNRD